MNKLVNVRIDIEVIPMTALAEEILKNFDRLPNAEQLEIAIEILRRLVNFDFQPLTDDDLVLNAE